MAALFESVRARHIRLSMDKRGRALSIFSFVCFGGGVFVGRIQRSFVGTGFGEGSTVLVRISFVWRLLLGAWQWLSPHESEGTLTVPVGESSSRRVCRRFPSTLKNNQHAKGGRSPFFPFPSFRWSVGVSAASLRADESPSEKDGRKNGWPVSCAFLYFVALFFYGSNPFYPEILP